jgi:hypothetical protein
MALSSIGIFSMLILLKHLVFALLITVALLAESRSRAADNVVYQIKASYLYNFLQFITFQQSALTSDGNLNVCIIGPNNFGQSIYEIAGAKTPQATIRIIQIPKTANTQDLERCRVIYIVGSNNQLVNNILNHVNTLTTLTIGEYSEFVESGGFIELYIQNDIVRFKINKTLIGQTQFQVSAQLLSLGVTS